MSLIAVGKHCLPHVLKPLHFSHRIIALLRLSTKANRCYLKFHLTSWLWGENCFSATIGARGLAEVSKWLEDHPLRYLFQYEGRKSTLSTSFIAFSETEPLFLFLLHGICGTFLPNRWIGVSKTCGRKKFSFVWPTLSNLLPATHTFSNPATSWLSKPPLM